jgi:peptide/nickel transport system ATP-binding protein
LLAAVPRLDGARTVAWLAPSAGAGLLRGSADGCPFVDRCPRRVGPICDEMRPPRQLLGAGHAILCHIPAGELFRRQADLSGAAHPAMAAATP